MPDHSNGRWQTTGSKLLNVQLGAGRLAIAAIIVFTVAVVLRVPSCYESFWVDELHSAWCVWDGLSDVAPRADIGHQSPFYFVGLWFWKQIVGQSELALRLSSVLAVAASCVILTAGLARQTNSLLAGLTAGLVLAIESNSIFFGTELRPFALAILFASIAIVCFARLAESDARHDQRMAWIGLVVAILLAGLCQPTSLGVLILLPLTLCGLWLRRDRRQLMQVTLTDGLLLLTATAVGFALWSMTLGESWGQRQTWATFASAKSIDQLWQAWDWVSLWCLPLSVLIVATTTSRGASIGATWLLAGISLVATFVYWLVARMEWLPLWHRRYFIAVLPMLAFLCGGSVAAVCSSERLRKFTPLVAIGLLTLLGFRQDLHRTLPHYPVALAVRGEDWRGAVDWVQERAVPFDRVYVESGLIESRTWNPAGKLSGVGWTGSRPVPSQTTKVIEYLCYPLKGPYQLSRVELINYQLDLPLQVLYDSRSQIFLIVRRPASQIEINPTKWGWVHGNRIPSEVRSFGNVTVVAFGAEYDSGE